MSHRVGICSSCEANYKVPADFAADKAKCKSCGGVVEIGAVVDDPPPPPVPAKPVRKAEPKVEEHVPSGKKGDGPSMMEKLLAQRQADREQAEAPKKPAEAKAPAAAKKTPVKKASAANDETISSTGKPKARATSRKAAPSRSTRPSRSRRRGRGKDDGDEDGDEEEGGRKSRRQKKKSPVPLICTLLLIVVGGVAGAYFAMSGDSATEDMADTAKVDAEETPAEEPATDAADEEAAEEPTEETPAEEPVEEEKPKPVADRKPKVANPMDVDLEGLADFGAPPGCDADRWESLQEDAALLVDPQAGAAGGRAGKRLKEAGRLAIPALINVFKTRDMGSDAGFRDGDVLQRTLEKIYNGKNFGWKYTTEPNDHYYNRKVVENHWKLWNKYENDEAGWLSFTGLDKEGVKPSGDSGSDDLSTDELDALDDI